jgi:Asp-tRNA(Asn)/Glu-tRNA(Gln) amidotransferase A subunit family amidase
MGVVVTMIDVPELSLVPLSRRVIVAAEAYRSYGRQFEVRPDVFGPRLQHLLADGARVSSSDYSEALRLRAHTLQALGQAMVGADLLVTPTMPVLPWTFAEELRDVNVRPYPERARFLEPFNLTGQPAVSVPWALSAAGLPIGIHFVGRRHADEQVLSVAAAFEVARGRFPLPPDPRPVARGL